jgi:peptide/nickel transport system substrate-binding protein
MRRTPWLIGAMLAAVSLTTAGSAAVEKQSGPTARRGGTVIFGADQEPRALNNYVIHGSNQATTTWILEPILLGAYQVTPKLQFKPQLIAGHPKVTRRPFSLTYTIKRNARWNDGRPVSSNDFIMQYRAQTDPNVRVISRIGYEDIARAQRLGTKRVRFVFKKPFAPWKTLFGGPLPAHIFDRPEQLNTYWMRRIDNPKTGRPISNGPFQFGSWREGSQLTIVRNPRYWGKRANLSSITFRFVPDTQTQAQQIRGRELDMINPQPQLYLVPLRRQRALRVQSKTGPIWEHIDFNLGYQGRGDPALRKRFVREAIAYGINRELLVRQLFRRTGINRTLKVLHNPFFMPFSKFYRPFFNRYRYNPTRARQILERNGCRRGSDRIYVCQGQRLSFRFTTTSGNQLRELTQQVVQAQLRQIGISTEIQNGPSEVVFGPVINQGNYDLFLFAWVGTPDPVGNVNIFGCNKPQNRQAYCNQRVTRWLEASSSELNEKKRMALFNRAAQQMAVDIPLIPLYAKPSFLVHRTRVRGVNDNPSTSGPAWNSESWWVTS